MPTKHTKRSKSPLTRQEVLTIVNGVAEADRVRGQRMTQDTPISTDVWYLFGTNAHEAQELLLTPNRRTTIQMLYLATRRSLESINAKPQVIFNQSHVYAKLTFRELVCAILPLSVWWNTQIAELDAPAQIERLLTESPADILHLLMDPAQFRGKSGQDYDEDLLHMVRIIGYLALGMPLPENWKAGATTALEAVKTVAALYEVIPQERIWKELETLHVNRNRPPLWRVFTNRAVEGAVANSRQTIKADAAHQVFQLSARNLRWAVVDSGIDATHPAFSKAPRGAAAAEIIKNSRVGRTYDFTRLKPLMLAGFQNLESTSSADFNLLEPAKRDEIRSELNSRIKTGQAIDWDLLEPVLRLSHRPNEYMAPVNQHGTHVAGILAADWSPEDEDPIRGICPDIQLYDIRVFDKSGVGDEFTILAALQFIRHINQHRDQAVVQGVNLSFALVHNVESYACGATPVCEECTRLVGAGVVVVAAAGNRGYDAASKSGLGAYSDISITDPGNTEDVITVGATHREMPHKYGVSFFSSRGPTGDGRRKPDLVAPGEKITAPVPGNSKARLDGTSMAAPHVSGAAALLMARHRELIGQPQRIKEILCATATDLNREASFQGAGLVDILRALQSV